jgi:hypothetical protein
VSNSSDFHIKVEIGILMVMGVNYIANMKEGNLSKRIPVINGHSDRLHVHDIIPEETMVVTGNGITRSMLLRHGGDFVEGTEIERVHLLVLC